MSKDIQQPEEGIASAAPSPAARLSRSFGIANFRAIEFLPNSAEDEQILEDAIQAAEQAHGEIVAPQQRNRV